MGTKVERRKITGFVVDPAALMRLSIPFFALIIISVVTVMLIHRSISQTLVEAEVNFGGNAATVAALHGLLGRATMIGTFGLGIFGVAAILMWVVFSHRIFGPVVPIRRHVEKLIEGDFSSRIALRSADELKELAADLNRLAEKLSEKK